MDKMFITPMYMPEPPIPQIALPIINTSIDGAAPAIADPTSNRSTALRKELDVQLSIEFTPTVSE